MPAPGRAAECPCGADLPYANCCEPLHDNRVQAATALQLMRSRYAAYATGRSDHLFRTWHPRTRPVDVTPEPGLVWTGLTVRSTEAGTADDATGIVTFAAAFRSAAGDDLLVERSRFERRAGRWFYVDGEPG